MPLNESQAASSLEVLHVLYGRSDATALKRLKAINDLAAASDIFLADQSQEVIDLLMTQVVKPGHDADVDKAAAAIFALITQKLDEQRQIAQRRHDAQGHFDSPPLHMRGLKDQMQDHDITRLMPKSHGFVEVLVVLNAQDPSSCELIRQGIFAALAKKSIEEIHFPTGPGHWRGVYLTKPEDVGEPYKLELFDPYGPAGAVRIEEQVLGLLARCGIKKEQIIIDYTGPKRPQRDAYACGDFVCAYSNKKMKDSGASKEAYNARLIAVLEQQGNEHDALRQASRLASAGLAPVHSVSDSVSPPSTVPASKKSVPSADEVRFTQQEQSVFDATVSAQATPSVAYKHEVAELIKNRHSIFSAAEKASKKSGPLTDEELAAQMQAEEFTKAGFKP